MSGIEHAGRARASCTASPARSSSRCDSGAYLVESNMGRLNPFPGDDWTLAGYRASAAVARYSRRARRRDVRRPPRPTATSSAAAAARSRPSRCMESTTDVWDGAVPVRDGHPRWRCPTSSRSRPTRCGCSGTCSRRSSTRIEPGGSGDMYAGLTAEQRDALAEATRMGFPPRVVVRRRAARPGLHRRVVGAGRQHAQSSTRPTSRTSGPSRATSGTTRRRRCSSARVQHKTTVDRA